MKLFGFLQHFVILDKLLSKWSFAFGIFVLYGLQSFCDYLLVLPNNALILVEHEHEVFVLVYVLEDYFQIAEFIACFVCVTFVAER